MEQMPIELLFAEIEDVIKGATFKVNIAVE